MWAIIINHVGTLILSIFTDHASGKMSIRERIIKIDTNGRNSEYIMLHIQLYQDLRKNRNVWKIRKILFMPSAGIFSTSKRAPVVVINIPTRRLRVIILFSFYFSFFFQCVV